MGYTLATDLDGTLLYPKHPIRILCRENEAFLRELLAKGDRVVLASGRNPKMFFRIAKKLRAPMDLIGCNGGFVIDQDGKVSASHPIPAKLALDIYAELKDKYGILSWVAMDSSTKNLIAPSTFLSPLLLNGVSLFNVFSFRYREDNLISEKAFVSMISQGKAYKIMPVFGLGKDAFAMAKEAQVSLNDLFPGQITVAWAGQSLEITAPGVCKGKALLDYCQARDISPNDVFVVGDSGNDLSMFQAFPHSFAMAQAPAMVRAKAAHVVNRVSDIREAMGDQALLQADLDSFHLRKGNPA